MFCRTEIGELCCTFGYRCWLISVVGSWEKNQPDAVGSISIYGCSMCRIYRELHCPSDTVAVDYIVVSWTVNVRIDILNGFVVRGRTRESYCRSREDS